MIKKVADAVQNLSIITRAAVALVVIIFVTGTAYYQIYSNKDGLIDVNETQKELGIKIKKDIKEIEEEFKRDMEVLSQRADKRNKRLVKDLDDLKEVLEKKDDRILELEKKVSYMEGQRDSK